MLIGFYRRAMPRDAGLRSAFLGEFEQMLLLAILQAGDQAYAQAILKELDLRAGRRTDRGAMYTTLDRLYAKGLIDWTVEVGSPARGGRRRRLFRVCPAGLEALRASRSALMRLWDGLESLLSDPA